MKDGLNHMNPGQFNEVDFERVRLDHSGLGIASFAMGLLAVLGGMFMFVVAFTISGPHGEIDETAPAALAVVLGFLGSIFLAILGVVLGLIGVFQRDRNRVFTLVGLVLNGAIVLCAGAMLLLALVVQGA